MGLIRCIRTILLWVLFYKYENYIMSGGDYFQREKFRAHEENTVIRVYYTADTCCYNDHSKYDYFYKT